MTIKTLKSSIVTNSIPQFMIFSVDEPALCSQYIDLISSTISKSKRYYISIDEAFRDIQSPISKEYLYIIVNDFNVTQELIEELKKYRRYVILQYDEISKVKIDLKKLYKDEIITFSKLDNYTLLAYLQKQCKANSIEVSQDDLLELIDCCECDLGKCANEFDKIVCLGQANSKTLMKYMLDKGFSDYRQTNIFKFDEKILNGDVSVYSDKIKLDDSVVTVTVTLYDKARKRFIDTKQFKYVKIMKVCKQINDGILDDTMNAAYALDYLLTECV